MGIFNWFKSLFKDPEDENFEQEPVNRSPTGSRSNIVTNSNSNDAWRKNQDLVKGLEFCATLQLRTPLRVLRRLG